MKIAIVRLSSLGDIIKGASILQHINAIYPEAEITWIVDSLFGDILDYTDNLDNIIKINLKNLKRNFSIVQAKLEFSKLKRAKYDIVIDIHGMLKAALISKYISKNKVYGFDNLAKERASKLFYTNKINFRCDENEIFRFNSLVAQSLNYTISNQSLEIIKPFLNYRQKDYSQYDKYFTGKSIILAMGSSQGWDAKKYPLDKWIDIINLLPYNFLLIWGSTQEKLEAEIVASSSHATVLPKIGFNDLKYLIHRADLIVGNDTGPTHIGWAIGTKSIILLGCTDTNVMVESKNHIAIKSSSIVQHCKFKKDDLSIEEIDSKLVIKHIEEII